MLLLTLVIVTVFKIFLTAPHISKCAIPGNTAINTSLKTHSVVLSLFLMSSGYQNDTGLRGEECVLILRKWRYFFVRTVSV